MIQLPRARFPQTPHIQLFSSLGRDKSGTSLFPGAYVKMDIVKELKIKRRV
jgi:hypothetical protein